MIDSHAHITAPRFDDDRNDVLDRAEEAGVELVVCPGTTLADSRAALDLAHRHRLVLAAVGMDRDAAAGVDGGAIDRLRELADDDRCVAIGEIGLDYHYDSQPRDVQRAAFEAQLELARELDLPAIVHCRDAFDDCLPMLETAGVRGVLHCFSGDADTALRCCDLGLMISFAGQVTYKRSDDLREAARAVPSQHLMVETDSPYLAPQAVRGKRNEPAFVMHTARFLADLLGLTLDDVDRITSTNARLLFGLGADRERTIAYPIRDSLYVNLTNRCTNRCVFCPRSAAPRVKGHWLGMEREQEPTAEEVIAAIGDPADYDEIVFCGFGEPTLRLDVLLDVARWVKQRGGRTRLNTNGQGDLVAGEPIAPKLSGLIDSVSVSVNTADPDQYAALSRSDYGGRAYEAVLEFVRAAKQYVPHVAITALDYPGVDVEAVGRLAERLGVEFRSRAYKHLG